jgi:hypothetical protein
MCTNKQLKWQPTTTQTAPMTNQAGLKKKQQTA